MTRKDKDKLISFFRDAEDYDRKELLYEYYYNILKDDTKFAGEIDILSVSEQDDNDTEKSVKNLQDFAKKLYNKIIEGVCNVIETWDDDWIPTSERLPDHEDDVLVTARGMREVFTAIDHYDLDFETWEYFSDDGDILAWMPLPEPYTNNINTDKKCE